MLKSKRARRHDDLDLPDPGSRTCLLLDDTVTVTLMPKFITWIEVLNILSLVCTSVVVVVVVVDTFANICLGVLVHLYYQVGQIVA